MGSAVYQGISLLRPLFSHTSSFLLFFSGEKRPAKTTPTPSFARGEGLGAAEKKKVLVSN